MGDRDRANAKAAEAAPENIQKELSLLDGALEGMQYLTGDYTLADTHVSSFIDWLNHMKGST